MSTELIDEDDKLGFYLTRFFGGEKRGACFQISQENGVYVQLTQAQMTALCHKFTEVADSDAPRVLPRLELAHQEMHRYQKEIGNSVCEMCEALERVSESSPRATEEKS